MEVMGTTRLHCPIVHYTLLSAYMNSREEEINRSYTLTIPRLIQVLFKSQELLVDHAGNHDGSVYVRLATGTNTCKWLLIATPEVVSYFLAVSIIAVR